MSDSKEKEQTTNNFHQFRINNNTYANTDEHLDSTITTVNIPTPTDQMNYKMNDCANETIIEAPYSVFKRNQKVLIVFIVSGSSIVSSISANIYLPAVLIIQKDLSISSEMVNLTITMYMAFQAFSPSFWGTLADHWGRRPIYIVTFSIYTLACVGLACTKNYATLLSLRMLQAFGSSSSIAIGAGTIGDIASPLERGGYMGVYAMGTTAGQMIGPFLGGTLGHILGWRWIFWFLVIFTSCLIWILQVLFLPETLRKLVGNGSGYANPTPIQYWKKKKHQGNSKKNITHHEDKSLPLVMRDNNNASTSTSDNLSVEVETKKFRFLATLPNPFRSLVFLKEKDVLVLLLYNSLQYGAMFTVLSSITELFVNTYGINEFQVGLCFLSSGFGAALGSLISGKILNWKYRKMVKKLGFSQDEGGVLDRKFPIESARMGITWIYGIIFNVLLIAYGWCIYFRYHIAVPVIIIFILGFTSTATFNATNTLLVDLFPHHSASIVACNNIPRCLIGGFSVMLVHPGIQRLGVGWFFTTISLILFISRLSILLELKYGPQWRKDRFDRQE